MNFGTKGFGFFLYRLFEVLKVSRKPGADSCGTPLVSGKGEIVLA